MKNKFIVGLSGTHGTGKSTILNGLRAAGIPVAPHQLSRAAQASLGWDSLSVANTSIEHVWMLQHAILEAAVQRDMEIVRSKTLTVVERTFADNMAYAGLWCKKFGIDIAQDKRYLDFAQECKQLAQQLAGVIIVPINDKISFVADPRRADEDSRQFISDTISQLIVRESLPNSKFLYMTLTSTSAADRTNEALTFINSLDQYGN